jgi:glyoxylase-like metal-dependent hydrolase (beta-lactamase superfamily II)
MIQPIELGRFRLYPLLDGTFKMDGGAMFGVVPRVLWGKIYQADEQHRIQLAVRPLLVEAGSDWILIDTGMGDKFDDKYNKRHGIERLHLLEDELRQLGLSTLDIKIVINTHLHWDHAGGNTTMDPATGEWLPTFSNARYLVQRGEYEFATHLNERTRGSYRHDDYVSLKRLGYFDFVDGNASIAPGVRLLLSGGHVPYHQCVLLESDKNKAFYLGDLIPTHAHLALPYIAGFDIEPLTTLVKKKEYLSLAADEEWTLFFDHDPEISFAKIVREKDSYQIQSI